MVAADSVSKVSEEKVEWNPDLECASLGAHHLRRWHL